MVKMITIFIMRMRVMRMTVRVRTRTYMAAEEAMAGEEVMLSVVQVQVIAAGMHQYWDPDMTTTAAAAAAATTTVAT